jgi:hypothetical protein
MKSTRKGKANGGAMESPASGTRDYKKDEKPNLRYTYQSNVNDEAEERKHGGMVKGKMSKANASRMPRKSGGRAGSNMNPLSSAHAGTAPKGRKIEMND